MFETEAAILEKHIQTSEKKEHFKKLVRQDSNLFKTEEKKKRKKIRCCVEDDDSDDYSGDEKVEDTTAPIQEERCTNEESKDGEIPHLREKYKVTVLRNAELESEVANLMYQVALLKDNLEDVQEEFEELKHSSNQTTRQFKFQRSQVTSLTEECESLRHHAENLERIMVDRGVSIVEEPASIRFDETTDGDATPVRRSSESSASPEIDETNGEEAENEEKGSKSSEEQQRSVSEEGGGEATENGDIAEPTTCLDDSKDAIASSPQTSATETVTISKALLDRLCVPPEEYSDFEGKLEKLLTDHETLLKETLMNHTKKREKGGSSSSSNDTEHRLKRYTSRQEELVKKIEGLDNKVEKVKEEISGLKKREDVDEDRMKAERKRLQKEMKETQNEVEQSKEDNASLVKKFEKFKKSIRMPWSS